MRASVCGLNIDGPGLNQYEYINASVQSGLSAVTRLLGNPRFTMSSSESQPTAPGAQPRGFTLVEFMRPYRLLPGGQLMVNGDDTTANNSAVVDRMQPVVSTAHPPRSVLACIAIHILDELDAVHSAGRVFGHLSEHDVSYYDGSTNASADSKQHRVPSARIHHDRCEVHTPHTADLIQHSDEWKWTLSKSAAQCTPDTQRPSHYCTATVPLYHALRPSDVEHMTGGDAYFRVYNVLNDYEALVYLLVNMFASFHDRIRLNGLQRTLRYRPPESDARRQWFWKLSMAYYPPWAKAMLHVIDHERECILREPLPRVRHWKHDDVQRQLETLLVDIASPVYPDDWYPMRSCVNPGYIPGRMSRQLVPTPQQRNSSNAWARCYGARRTALGSEFYGIVQARVDAWLDKRSHTVVASVVEYHRTFMALEGDVTSTVVPRQLLRGTLGSARTHVDSLFSDIMEEAVSQLPADQRLSDATVVDMVLTHRLGANAIRYAKAMHRVLTALVAETRNAAKTIQGTATTSADASRATGTRMASLTALELALVIAYSEEVMQVLVDNVDGCESLDELHTDVHECVTNVDAALHHFVVAVLEHHGEAMLNEARELMERGCYRAHTTGQLLFTSDQYARLFVMTRMRIQVNTPHLSRASEAKLALAITSHVASQLQRRIDENRPRHANDRHKASLLFEDDSRIRTQRMIDEARRLAAAAPPQVTTTNRDLLP